MKLWIIYKNGIGFIKIVAEMLQDRLEDYIDVSVGTAKKIDPVFLAEEKLDYLMIGDTLIKEIPSIEIQNWLIKYWEISKKKKLVVKAISGFYVPLNDITVKPLWDEFLQDNGNAEIIYPPILRLRLKKAGLELENRALELIKEYSSDFIEFLINDKKRK
ncbi:hypothetical protein LCGC14_0828340 [marine sediment metagenome]|uniref:Flavodoxin domain-containing protein n=1 Tax=marine sediment metagenome TaxID=412755 RepID=A0A0F9PGQ1_9ZZZZ|nr:hypothetical protein [archaeon]HEC40721.1 hypothetical protein [bacterium]